VGQSGTVSWGTIGITAPTSATAALSGYNDVGYIDQDGVTMSVTPTVEDLFVWQATTAIRRVASETTIAFSGNLAEYNAAALPVVFGGGTVAAGTYTFPADASTNDFAGVIDVVDGSTKLRFVFPKANQTESVESSFNRTSLATLSFNFGVLSPGGGTAPLVAYKNGNF
jgi:hypothetical protein